ncbi:type II toxin -antitoxin system TacA 1-like antitoxin [Scytonema sp. NUACC21]
MKQYFENYQSAFLKLEKSINSVLTKEELKNRENLINKEISELVDNSATQYKNNTLVLSERDSMRFLEIMNNPPEPSDALLSIFK